MKASRVAVGLAAATATALVAWRLYRRRNPARRSCGTVGFAGLGNMGTPMARRLLPHCDGVLTVWNRSEAKAMPLQAAGALVAPSLRFLFESCDTVLCMLMGDESLTAAVDEALGCQHPPAVIVNHATVSPDCARRCAAACAAKNVAFVTCTVTGRPDRAAAGKLACWVSAAEAGAANMVAESLCPALAAHIAVLSTTDAAVAATYKLWSNFMVYGGAELLAEATALAEAVDLPRGSVAQLLEVLAPGSIWAGYATKIRDRAYAGGTATTTVGLKDLRLIRGLAGGATLPALDAALDHMSAAAERLGEAAASTADWCVLSEEVERRARETRARRAPPPMTLATDAAARVAYRIMTPADVDSVLPVLARAFFEGEPVTGACGCTQRDHSAFCAMFVPRMAAEGNTVVAVDMDSGAVLGGFLCEDFNNDDPPEMGAFVARADGKWSPVVSIIEELEAQLIAKYAIPAEPRMRPAGKHFHLWMLGVAPEGRGRGIAKGLTRHSIEWARARGFSIAFAETTGALSTHILGAHAKAVAFADYATWAGDECVEQVRALPANGHRGMSMMVAEF